ncbi:MAG TPA: HD domain-containing phosphohydrolase [Burkholderiaceae bacterium]|nr:HD domain-containing phosphohydrolase [Burkholderiaceae bacterium]
MNSPDPKYYLLAAARLHRKRPVVASRAVYNVQGVKLLDQGVGVDERVYERLMQHRLAQPVEECLSSEPGVNGRVLREVADDALRRWGFFDRMLGAPKTREVVLEALESVPLPPAIAFSLTLARESFPDLFEHSVLAALCAGWLAWTPVAARHDVAVAVAAGLLHDLGMLYADPALGRLERRLTSEQRRQLYAHPVTSALLVERHHDYPKPMVRAILEHHELLDGSGYPRALAAQATSPLGRVLALAELTSAMFTRDARWPELRLSLALRMNRDRYDAQMLGDLVGLLESGVRSALRQVPRLDDALPRLRALAGLLVDWRRVQAGALAPDEQARVALARTGDQVERVLRSMAGAGVSPEQLAWLAHQAIDDVVAAELSVIGREAAWQAQAVVRFLRRQWAPTRGVPLPRDVELWQERLSAACDDWMRVGRSPCGGAQA